MGNYAQEQRQQQQVIGGLIGVIQKSPENFQAQVVDDGGHTKNLWTKDRQLVSYLMSQIGNRLAFVCNISQYNRNGQPTTSLWIDQVGSPSVGSPAMAGPQVPQAPYPQPAGAPMPQPQGIPVTPSVTQGPVGDPKQPFIHRQTASKVAATLLGYLPEEERTMSNLLVLAERLVAYYDSGLPQAENLDQLMQRAMPAGMDSDAAQGVGYDNTPPDDIPF